MHDFFDASTSSSLCPPAPACRPCYLALTVHLGEDLFEGEGHVPQKQVCIPWARNGEEADMSTNKHAPQKSSVVKQTWGNGNTVQGQKERFGRNIWGLIQL